MSLFGSSSFEKGNYEVPVIEGYTVENDGDLFAVEEGARDLLNVVKSMHGMDMARLESASDYEVVVEGMVKDTLAKIKKFFKDLAGKIKSFLASLVMAFDALTKNGNDFAKKYENALKKRDLKGMEVKLHKYTNLDFNAIEKLDIQTTDQVGEKLDQALSLAQPAVSDSQLEEMKKDLDDSDTKEEELSALRGKVVGKGSLTSEEFPEALYSHFRDGASSKHDVPEGEVKIADVLANLRDTKPAKDVKTMATKFSKRLDAVVAQTNRAADAIEKSADKAGDAASFTHKTKSDTEHTLTKNAASLAVAQLRRAASMTQSSKAIGLTAIRALKSAISERTRVSKAICLKAATYKPEKK